jgi:hypothetical protein
MQGTKLQMPGHNTELIQVVGTAINISSHFNNYYISFSPGIIPARAGLSTPLSFPARLYRRSLLPLNFPALTTASAFPAIRSSKATRMEESFFPLYPFTEIRPYQLFHYSDKPSIAPCIFHLQDKD